MKKRIKNVISVIGVIFLIIGITSSITFFAQDNYLNLILSLFSVIMGVILLAISFGE